MHTILEEGGQHLLLLLSILGGGIVVWRFARAERDRRVTLLAAQREQTALLKSIDRELHPNGGDSVSDRVTRIEESITDQHRTADRFFKENATAHDRLNERIDLLMTGNRVNPTPRKQAERHRSREDEG